MKREIIFADDRGSSGGGFGKSDRGGGGSGGSSYGGGDMEIQQDTIFVSGCGEDCSEEAMVQHFGSIGVIKVCDWLLEMCNFLALSLAVTLVMYGYTNVDSALNGGKDVFINEMGDRSI